MHSIVGGFSVPALVDYLHLWDAVDSTQLTDQPDKTIWRWTADGTYSAKSAYNMLHAGSTPLLGHKLIWKTWAPLRIKIFLWLAFKRRHWTWDRRARHGLEARELCYLCDQGQETIDHCGLPILQRSLVLRPPGSQSTATTRSGNDDKLVAETAVPLQR